MLDKRASRLKRAARTRAHLKSLQVHRLTVHRSLKHMRAQIIAPSNGQVIVSSSTLEKKVREQFSSTSNKQAAEVVGKILAERALEKGILKVGFDRSGFKYHGRVATLAQAARDAGLQF